MMKSRSKRVRVGYRARKLPVDVRYYRFVRTADVDRFVHDLRTPLTVLRAGLGLLEMRLHTRLTPDEERLLKSLGESAMCLTRMINERPATELRHSTHGNKLY